MEKSEMNLIKFNGKNYSSWAYQFELYLKGKALWGHISGSQPKPTDEDKIEKWETKEAKITSWIFGSVDPQFFLHFKPSKTAKEMWEYLKTIYHQENPSRRIQLEHEISPFYQGNQSIQEYYFGFRAHGQNTLTSLMRLLLETL
eukprot:TRINITY_DN5675_c1_g2_i1.p1 TRINITY_DN5675_c1_g2~~TRINITY_DN5675_c1_g2_i1.p1  ORF type:complete len:144 (+),score=17.37 TRINITY_DN5675_c1_g2_i1:175-606(+)